MFQPGPLLFFLFALVLKVIICALLNLNRSNEIFKGSRNGFLRKAFDDEENPYLPKVCLLRSVPFHIEFASNFIIN
jgi:hypothetical protein